MHRFRKRSDPTRSRPSDEDWFTPTSQLPELPPASDFRTSLILPDLTRRFTLLRSSSGDPLTLDDLRSKFAEQRARGVPNPISEEEEDMILETLGRMRAKNAVPSTTSSGKLEGDSGANVADMGMESDYTHERTSHISTTTSSTTYPASSITSSPSPSSRSTKRYSNNLFASGRFREYSYLRSVSQRSGSSRGAASITPSDSEHSLREKPSSNYSESLRPGTPEGSGPVSSVPSSPNEKTPLARSTSLISSVEDFPSQALGDTNKGSTHLSGNSSVSVQRVELALECVIRDFEEEAEDEILMPRTAHPAPRSGDVEQSSASSPASDSASGASTQSPIDYEGGTAILSDKQMNIDPEMQRLSPTPLGRAGTISPTPRLPGYIPGMPRPMTPRDPSFDSDDARAHSATPRAMSPTLPNVNGLSSLITTTFTSSLLRRGSDASRSTPRPISPSVAPPASSFLSRSAGGQYSSDSQRESASSTDQEASVSSAFRRKPVSPLTGSAFRPMVISSRPGTPSNITWNVNSPSSTPSKSNRTHSRQGSSSSHSRNGSLSTDTDFQSNADKPKSPNRPVRVPVPPESPIYPQVANTGAWNRSTSPAPVDHRSQSSLSGVVNYGSSLSFSSRSMRAPTPTQSRSTTASPAFSSNDSPGFSHHTTVRSPKHHSKSSSHFSLGLAQPVAFSALANSSRSSLESTGSSYHSWSAGQKKDVTLDLFSDVEQSRWHDLDKSSSVTPGSLQDDEDFEDIIRRYAGLTKSDFMVIQDKLVSAARAKESSTEPRERSNSLRRRRPSTSQSNYSQNGRDNRVASPPPNQPTPAQVQVSPTGRRSPAPDQAAKAHALLDSVVGSIPRAPTIGVVTDNKVELEEPSEIKASPTTTRRNRDLARALGFGDEQGTVDIPQDNSPPVEVVPQSNDPPQIQVPSETTPQLVASPAQGDIQLSSNASPYSLPFRSASVRSPRPLMDQAELVNEVRRKAEAATAALMKTSSGQKFIDANASSISVTRKKITPSQISAPHLVSAPTSVETIPLPQQPQSPTPTPIAPQPSLNITQRMRRLRNTLKIKQPAPSGEEVTPFPIDLQPNNAPPSASLNRRPTLPLTKGFAYGSSTDLGKAKSQTSMSSPPASASPGLRGFMSRFRKARAADAQPENGNGLSRASPTASSPTTSSHHGQGLVASPVNTVSSTSAPVPTPTSMSNVGSGRPSIDAPSAMGNDSAAVKQLFEAATNLGLDQAALNDLLARSASVSSRTAGWSLSRNPSNAAASSSVARGDLSAMRSRSPLPEPQFSDDGGISSGGDDRTVRKLSIRKTGESSHNHQAIPENPAIVRRTLIFPSDFRASKTDLSQMARKPSGKRHRRPGSATSAHSGRSVHDRAPTPPPPKSNGGKRFSTDRSPPLPASMTAQAEALLHPSTSAAPVEKPSSAYDSLYDMYAGESKNPNAPADDAVDIGSSHEEGHPEGAALELIEMANGETIWSIVNGLRDDDLESVYASRTSLASDYSLRENTEGLQVFVKEHGRSTSKGSSSSFLSRKKPSQNKNRPETKVFYSSSTHIGRLIESLSQGMDAGSFNFGNLPPDRSTPLSFHSDTDMHWTVEEKLEHMLGSMRNP
ncbi:hypothetical protein DEU56DRAFT_764445 [Suillus clintonianus]|uniref:uncharacterized protein n=1 Tax=Suillus clintonianus TaxID=1904413 RepID=UPI001B86624B|nr:uncharacterized protein DEU56DRAFT_764445 [Suillus clintonianus]KAG2157400.1 hypothetical protein DEU56DRAFT_764445 [Suillus clintonianus]